MHRSNVLAAILVTVVATLLGCSAPPGEIRAASVQALPGCPLDSVATLALEALDDGPARAGSFAEVALDRPTELPTIPAGTRAFAAHGKAQDGTLTALGLLEVGEGEARGPLFRVGLACGLLDPTGAAAHVSPVFGASIGGGNGVAVLAGGRGEDGGARADLVAIDVRTGGVARAGLRRRRAGAAVFVLGDRAIVAGGDGDAAVWDDAEVVDLSTVPPSFAAALGLSEPRADAGAVVLASGRALLVGGRGQRGALATLETLDPSSPVGSTIDLARLSKPRVAPVVARLATGHVVVLGGHDDAGAPVADLELFDPTARSSTVLPFAAAKQVDAIALPSGALLIAAADDGDTALFLLRLDGVDALGTLPRGPRPPRFFAGTDGAPFLFDGSFRRYRPWTFDFDDAGALPLAPDPRTSPFTLADGVIGALHADGSSLAVTASRYDVRSSLVVDPQTLGLGTTAHLSPDRKNTRVERDGLVLPPSARVAVTDATYGGVSVRAFARGRDLPAIELRTAGGDLVVRVDADGPCSYPKGDADFAEVIRERDGAISVTVGEATGACAPLLPGAPRVVVSMVAGAREARVRGIAVSRR